MLKYVISKISDISLLTADVGSHIYIFLNTILFSTSMGKGVGVNERIG